MFLHRDYCRTEDLLENLMHALNPFSFNNHFTLSTNIGNYFYYKLWNKNRKPDKNCCHCNWIAEFIFTLCIKTTSASHKRPSAFLPPSQWLAYWQDWYYCKLGVTLSILRTLYAKNWFFFAHFFQKMAK